MQFKKLLLTAALANSALSAPIIHYVYTTVVKTVVITAGQTAHIGDADQTSTSFTTPTAVTPTDIYTPVVATTTSSSSTGNEKVVVYTYMPTFSSSSSSSSSTTIVVPPTTSTAAPVTTTTAAPTTSTTPTSTAAATTAAAASNSDLDSFQSEILSAHNSCRAKHGVDALTWDSEVAAYAQAYADKYTCSGSLTHSGGQYGENLAIGYTTTGAVDAWYGEGENYDYSTCSVYDHFTQVVWKSTTKVGCAYKYCNSYWGTYIICSYETPGNVIGYGIKNVLPPV
ncbi:hypothetical protein B5S28_g3214 [[Candida] boidinii]|uniref:Unnamed protein product n=1 Tax=Candida boidinii TaxID=5477 RepID=A0ACB5U1H3_CANBO|nr:hypothetical protein B5S28_g3214 [[Candida] boidinii]OWB74176.1 hypothetical protein B5S31_g3959 [[Candida] boidinii]GME99936.1 unnamed protein product [[Candida] boidinii]